MAERTPAMFLSGDRLFPETVGMSVSALREFQHDSGWVRAFNLSTGEIRWYTCDHHKAVRAAYAQERGDWNTWQYAERYDRLITEGKATVSCGDWTAIV